jgi:hypothetical protein
MKTTTRIETIASLNQKIDACKARRDTFRVNGLANLESVMDKKIGSLTQERDEQELSLYEDHGVTV